MVVRCCICKRQYDKYNHISFHVFPKVTHFRTAWEKACKFQQPVSKTARICSEHFTIDCFLPKRDYGIKLLKPSAVPSVFPWNQEDNSTTNNNINQTCVQDNATSTIKQNQDCSTIKQNQDCAHEIASSSCELTIPYNECNLPRTPSTKDTNTKYNLSLSKTPSKRHLEDTQMSNIPHKIWSPARINDLTLDHFSTRQRTLRSLQLIQEKTNQQAKNIKILQDRNRRLLKKVSSLQNLILHLTQKNLISENAAHKPDKK